MEMAALLAKEDGLAAIELNLSCPNVAGGTDFATSPDITRRIVDRVRAVCPYPIIAKLTPNVTNVVSIAKSAADGSGRCRLPGQYLCRHGDRLAQEAANSR